jgi:hypothetical protein
MSGEDSCFVCTLELSRRLKLNYGCIYLSISLSCTWVSSVGTETDCGLDGRGSIPDKSKKFLSTPQRVDRLCLHSLTYNRYRGAVSARGGAEREVDYSLVNAVTFLGSRCLATI